MNMDRKWIALAALMALLLVTACKKPEPVVTPPPPPITETAPPTDVKPETTPADLVDATEQKPPQSLQEIQAEAEAAGLLGDVFFDFDQSDLRSDARERLDKNARFMQSENGKNLTFTVEGHCDERGTNEYNIALGQNRSATAVDYLISLGISRSRLRTISYGEERPFCTESNEACWQKNRRARFVISGGN